MKLRSPQKQPSPTPPRPDPRVAQEHAEKEDLAELAALLSMSSLLEFWDNPEDDAAWAEYK